MSGTMGFESGKEQIDFARRYAKEVLEGDIFIIIRAGYSRLYRRREECALPAFRTKRVV